MSAASAAAVTFQQRQVRLVVGAVFVTTLAQMTLNPVIAPLARAAGVAEWQLGAVISAAALTVVVAAGPWGRRSQRVGRKPVLVVALGSATVVSALFAVTAWWGLKGVVTGTALFLIWLLVRGVAFGSAISAVAPTAQAFVAEVTTDQATRVSGMAGIGAAQGVAMVAGAVVGGVLAGIDLMLALVAVPVLLGVGAILVARRLVRQEPRDLVAQPLRVSWFDGRFWPFLLCGFGTFTALGFIQVLTGFMVQDRFEVDTERAALLTGGVLLAAGVGMIIAQAVIVPRSGWSPGTLVRVGSVTSAVGFLALLPDLGLPLFVAAIGVLGLGMGLASPGYVAGATMSATKEEQGSVAGLVQATNAATFVLAPLAGTALYGVSTRAPLIAALAAILAVLVLASAHPRLRSARRVSR